MFFDLNLGGLLNAVAEIPWRWPDNYVLPGRDCPGTALRPLRGAVQDAENFGTKFLGLTRCEVEIMGPQRSRCWLGLQRC
jgi:acyl transferase domain-containing protein